MYLLKASHDSLRHRGFYATKTLIGVARDVVFEGPVLELEKDCNWTGLRLQKTRQVVWSFDF